MGRKMIAVMALMALLATANATLLMRSAVRFEDLDGNEFMNDMLANTLKFRNKYGSNVPQDIESTFIQFEYKFLEAAPEKLEFVRDLLQAKLGEYVNSQEINLEQLAQERINGLWTVLTYVRPLDNESASATVVLFKWDGLRNKFDVHFLKSTNKLMWKLATGYLFKMESEFGIELGEPSQISRQANLTFSPEEPASALRYAKHTMYKAFERMTHIRGVDIRNPDNEMRFKNHFVKSNGMLMQKLGNPLLYIQAVCAVIKIAAKVWQAFASIFATKVKTELMGQFNSKGFREYSMTATLRRHTGIKDMYLDKALEAISKILVGNHPTKLKEIQGALVMARFMPEMTWSMDDCAIDAASSSHDRMFTILSNNENYGEKYNFMSLEVKTTFMLSPVLLVYKRTKSVFGGLFGEEKAIFKEQPPNVTDDDVKAIRAFNLVMAVKMISDEPESTEKLQYPQFP